MRQDDVMVVLCTEKDKTVEIIEYPECELTFFRQIDFQSVFMSVYPEHISYKVHLDCIPFCACSVMFLG